MLLRILPLFMMMGFGVLAGALGLFRDPREAVTQLNRYVLYVSCPLLILGGLASRDLAMPSDPGFYLLHVLALCGVLVVVRLVGWLPRLREHAGTLALCTVYGNITYLGIPFCERAFGREALGLASLSSGVHTILATMLGTVLFLRWNRQGPDGLPFREVLLRVSRQPLVWAPVVGLLVRLLPDGTRDFVVDSSLAIGVSAGPVAIFMIGLYIWVNRSVLARVDGLAVTINALKLAAYPVVTFGVAVLLSRWFALSGEQVAIAVSMAAMPVAATTFSISEEFGMDREVVASSILLSSVVSLPLLSWLAGALSG